jgi:DNA-binding SARP family transcriptional activator/Tfp pilus assembly protein PilF
VANLLCINVLGGLYVTAERRPLAGAGTQPRRLAVLALLAVAGERGVNREQFLTYLWPDNDEERGRHALTQALYALRRDLGADELFLGQQEVRLNPDLVTSDYAEFHDAIRSDAPEHAVECYRGPFLQGFRLSRADNFERWVEEQRDALGHEYGRALETAARRAVERQDFQAAVGFLKRQSAQDPFNPKVAVRLMETLAAQGAVVAALQHARVHELLVKQELDLPPDPEVTALAARLRTTPRDAPAGPPPGETQPARGVSPEPVKPEEIAIARGPWSENGSPGPGPLAELPTLGSEPVQPRKHRWGVPGAIMLVTLAAVSLAVGLARRPPPPLEESGRPVIAVGLIADYSGKGPDGLGQPLADMLATNLARGSGFRVISNVRMLELIRQLRSAGDSVGVVGAAARQAGAAELIDGALYAIAPNRYRLDLRRVDLASGAVIRAYKVEGADLFALVDSGTLGLVPDLGGAVPTGSLADASTASTRAYQAYGEGLRRYYEGDRARAERLFRQALELDSGFAQAAFYYAIATTSESRSETLDRLRRAVKLSGHAGDRERLVIQAEWAAQNSSPALAAIADTLMIRYPEEVDGYYYAAEGANLLGNYQQAVAGFRRAIALDSLDVRSAAIGRCRVCEAYLGLGYSYSAIDSVGRAHAVFREWIRRQPTVPLAWRTMAGVYAYENQLDSAFAALRLADSLEPNSPMSRRSLISILSRLERYSEMEQLLRAEMQGSPATYGWQVKWDLAVTLRKMGRLREALPLAHEYRMGIRERLLPGAAPYNALLEGQVLFELGRYRAAAALFDSIGVGQQGDFDASLRARDRIWAWVHEADALAQLGDTARLRFLADSMEILGRGVAHARDRQLHAHVRGLLARVRGRDAEAADWFRRAIVSPVIGFTRSNYELAGVYLRTNQAADAVRILRSATYAGTDGSGLYVTQTDLEARLAEAFDSAAQADSALLYYRKVLRAWERADRQFWPRRDSIVIATKRLEAAGRH